MPETSELIRASRPKGRFANPGDQGDRSWFDVLKWKLTSRGEPWPKQVEIKLAKVAASPESRVRATWVGHSTFLLQFPGCTILTDPVWSPCVGPFGRVGIRRVHAPGVTWESLPPVDIVLLSHDHYDHCDLPTLRRISARWPRARLITPAGYEDIARRTGFTPERHSGIDWWESGEPMNNFTITGTPARHWSNRLSSGRNHRHWGGYHLRANDGTTVFFAGDTAYDPVMFKQIHDELGAPNLALLPIGAYAPRWFMRTQHCDPTEAVKIHQELGVKQSVAMHWGTFPMTDEGREAPRVELTKALAAAALPPTAFIAPHPGTVIDL